MATPPYIEVTFDPPSASDTDSVFDTKASDTVGKLTPWGTEANELADWIGTKADQALAAATGGDLPALTGYGGDFLRVKSDESAAEFYTIPVQPTADWEAGISTIEGIVSPAKAAASAAVNSPVKSWVNFNGTGTVAIRDSLNVLGITDNGTGDYTINFDTALVDANYSVGGNCIESDATQSGSYLDGLFAFSFSTDSVRIQTANDSSSASYLTDMEIVNVQIFR
jgi:hypothetical protein